MVAATPKLPGVPAQVQISPERLVLGSACVPEVHGDVSTPQRIALVVKEWGTHLCVSIESVVAPGQFGCQGQIVPRPSIEAKVDFQPFDNLSRMAGVSVGCTIRLQVVLSLALRKLVDHGSDIARLRQFSQAIKGMHHRIDSVAPGCPDGVHVFQTVAHCPHNGGHWGVRLRGQHIHGDTKVAHNAPWTGSIWQFVSHLVAFNPVCSASDH
mmetsp:Transcript_14684/g.26083  ORF Transcript_14684/g.26083 Transcript_14684/m.26083 type:complete len:211 (+) Transcript_14684:1232-1864(+)